MEKFRYLAKEKISEIPRATGVYAFQSGEKILYIGKAANLRDRVKNHFHLGLILYCTRLGVDNVMMEVVY